MSDFVRQLPALIGVVVGALASLLGGAVLERGRWKREQAGWRRGVYSGYGLAVKRVYVQCVKIGNNCLGLGRRTEEVDYEQAKADLAELTDQRTAVWESVLLLGDRETIEAGRAWHRTVWQVERFARKMRTDADAWQPLLDDLEILRVAFYKAARKNLRIKGGDPPAAGPWGQETDEHAAPAPGAEPVAAEAETPPP